MVAPLDIGQNWCPKGAVSAPFFLSALSKSDEKFRAHKIITGGPPAPALYTFIKRHKLRFAFSKSNVFYFIYKKY